MTYEEALAWLNGERSMWNLIANTSEDRAHEQAETARADAALTEQAYWIVRARAEGLVEGTLLDYEANETDH